MTTKMPMTIHCDGQRGQCPYYFGGEPVTFEESAAALVSLRGLAASAGWTNHSTGDLCEGCSKTAEKDLETRVGTERLEELELIEAFTRRAAARGDFVDGALLALRADLGEERWQAFIDKWGHK